VSGHDVAAEPRSVRRVIALAAALMAGSVNAPGAGQWGHGI